MISNLDSWKKNWALMRTFYSGDEISTITARLSKLKIQTVAFCSFESRFAKSGGLAAVTTNILPYLKEVNNVPDVILISPFYPRIMDEKKLRATLKSFKTTFNKKDVAADIFEYTWSYDRPVKGMIKEYYVRADGFFDTHNKLNDPYMYESNDSGRNAAIQSDNALFFCKAVPMVLNALGIKKNIIMHLNEWQTSLISLTSKEAMLNGTLESCGTVQTMHNSYDSGVSWSALSNLFEEPRRKKLSGAVALSAYQIGLQLVDAPVTTVSDHFADELTSDILQTGHYAPHLQTIMKKSGVSGINNGMFIDLSPEFARAEKYTADEIKNIKLKMRKSLLRILSTYKPPERFGELTYKGKTISKLPDHIPILAMSGRLDPIQKGFDIFLRAAEKFSEDEIKVVLTPMAVNPSDLDYFYEIACKCRGNVTVFPVRLQKGYHELQTGATFGIMPSIYEPFGAAVEYMASGTVNIGRATGGLVDQIDNSCGFLYKEDAVFYTAQNIEDFVNSSRCVQTRKTNPWVQSMADNLYNVIKKAIDVYRNQPDRYYQMILSGLKKAGQFGWEANAKKYYSVYKLTSKF
ncbi:MAG: glycogen/starch synthase [Nitrospirota bacterium]